MSLKEMSVVSCERGATAVEYAMFAALIAAVIVVTVVSLGTSVQSMHCAAMNALEVVGIGEGCN